MVRTTVLFPSKKSLQDAIEWDDQHVNISPNEKVMVQTRTEVPVAVKTKRMTWFHDDHFALARDARPGFCEYLDLHDVSQQDLDRGFILTPTYGVYCSRALPVKWADTFGLNGKYAYEITFADNATVDEYRYTDEPFNVTQGALGAFYIDLDDGHDVNLSGLEWSNGAGHQVSFFMQPFHHWTDAKVNAQLLEPVGLHPTIKVEMQQEGYMFLQLDKYFFVDQFQSDPIFVFGETDLELPEYKVNGWGSESLWKLSKGINEIKLHSRYVKQAGVYEINPHIFYTEDKESDITETPFSSKGYGYESYFTNNTVFYHLDAPTLTLTVPYLDSSAYFNVQILTSIVIALGTIYLLFKIYIASFTKYKVA